MKKKIHRATNITADTRLIVAESFEPFAPEPPVTAPCWSTSLVSPKTLPVLTDKENFDILLVQEEEIFKTIPERAQFSQKDREKDKKQYKIK